MATPSITNGEAAAGRAVRGVDIGLPGLLVAIAQCDRRQDFSRPCGARFTELPPSQAVVVSKRFGGIYLNV
jgi:hypothetical protein